jgi:putative phage-type endonuclease
MGITEAQLARRVGNIGASQVAAILGVSPWSNSTDVWYEVTGRVEPLAENPAMELGNLLEPVMVAHYRATHPEYVVRAGGEYRLAGTPILVHPDARAYDSNERQLVEIVEAKSAGTMNSYMDLSEWGEAGTDEVPLHYLIQCMTQLAACNAEACSLVALLAGRGLVQYQIERDDELIQRIVEMVCKWHDEYVRTDTKPEALPPSLETIKRVRRDIGVGGEVQLETARRWYEAKQRLKVAQAEADEAQAALLHSLPEGADFGTVDGQKVFGYGLCKGRTGLDTDRLKAEHPEIYAAYQRVGASYRRLAPAPKALTTLFGGTADE